MKKSRREQKRQETLKRISEKGLKLFIAKGYEGTTLEAIAAAAGISPRTFLGFGGASEHKIGLRNPSEP